MVYFVNKKAFVVLNTATAVAATAAVDCPLFVRAARPTRLARPRTVPPTLSSPTRAVDTALISLNNNNCGWITNHRDFQLPCKIGAMPNKFDLPLSQWSAFYQTLTEPDLL